MNHGVDGGSLAGMLKAHIGLECIQNGFYNKTLGQHEFIKQRHEIIFHGLTNAGNQMQAALPQGFKQVLSDITFISIDFSLKMHGDSVEYGTVRCVARSYFESH